MTRRSRLNIPAPTEAADFEGKVRDALRQRHRNVHLTQYGRRGQAQRGIDGWDPLAHPGEGIVWQATLTRRSALLAKLDDDLAKMDEDGREPGLFILAVGIQRDRVIQDAVAKRSADRDELGLCPVEVLFWEDIRQFFLENDELFSSHYGSLIPKRFRPNEVERPPQRLPALVAVEAATVSGDEDDPRRCLWQMTHLARMCDGLSPAELRELEGALAAASAGVTGFKCWSNGTTARYSYGAWDYPNGESAKYSYGAWNYPNGESAKYSYGAWNYPNGETARYSHGRWSLPDGRSASGESAVATFGLGAVESHLRDAVSEGLAGLSGDLRTLALIQLAWLAHSVS